MIVVISALAGCGSSGTGVTEVDRAMDTSQGPTPGKNTADEPARPTMPPARAPVLHVSGAYTYNVQILDAKTMVDVPNNPPPAGTMALALLLRVEADPRNRSVRAPTADLGLSYPSLETDMDEHSAVIGTVLDDGTPYLTEDQMLFGGGEAKGIDPVFGVLQANTVYYRWVWQIVSEKANLTDASLCEALITGDNCIPIGAITSQS
ncbi:hypothetical protein ACWHLZ_45120 [Streptomyces chartreusis]